MGVDQELVGSKSKTRDKKEEKFVCKGKWFGRESRMNDRVKHRREFVQKRETGAGSAGVVRFRAPGMLESKV